MVNKWFALASVTALTGVVSVGVVSGCSSDDNTVTPPADAGNDARDAAKKAASGDDDDNPPQCWTDEPIDVGTVLGGLAYMPPRVEAGSCSPAVFAAIKAIFGSNASIGLNDLKNGLVTEESQACSDCVFGTFGDTWAPIVTDGTNTVMNTAGCMEVVTGSRDCGDAFFKYGYCTQYACQGCAANSPDHQECLDAVAETACADTVAQVNTLCSSNGLQAADYLAMCDAPAYNIDKVGGAINVMCVGSPSDAGTDGGDAGDQQ